MLNRSVGPGLDSQEGSPTVTALNARTRRRNATRDLLGKWPRHVTTHTWHDAVTFITKANNSNTNRESFINDRFNRSMTSLDLAREREQHVDFRYEYILFLEARMYLCIWCTIHSTTKVLVR